MYNSNVKLVVYFLKFVSKIRLRGHCWPRAPRADEAAPGALDTRLDLLSLASLPQLGDSRAEARGQEGLSPGLYTNNIQRDDKVRYPNLVSVHCQVVIVTLYLLQV